MSRLLRSAERLFSSWRFPAFALALLVAYKLLLLAMLIWPVSDDPMGRFAEDFKTWCFGYDPATGEMEPGYVLMMLSEPVALGGILLLVWWRQLGELRAAPRLAVPYVAAALLVVGAGVPAAWALGDDGVRGELPFPAEALRTAHAPPALALTDHEGRPVTLEELRGRVVVLTGVYASCGYTCPMILGQARRAVAALGPDEQREVTVVGITLDPHHDTPGILAEMARGQGVAAPTFRLATGDPAQVDRVLDALQIARRRDPVTGVIDHANLFLLVDRAGRIAYRFTLGERQERWLGAALKLLLGETEPLG